MTKSDSLNYIQCAKTLSSDNLAVSAAELHGLITGVLCAGIDDKTDRLVLLYDYTSQGDIWPNNSKALAETLFNQTSSELNSELLDFTLLLPEDDAILADQAVALADWVSGFLAGFGIAGSTQSPSKESKEILEDLAQIAQLGIEEDVEELDQLPLLFEIREHVRICVLSLYTDNLLGMKSTPPRAIH